MKKTITLFALIFATMFGSSISAQVIGMYDHNSNDIAGDTILFTHSIDTLAPFPFYDHDGFVEITNISNDTVTLRVRRVEHQFIPGSQDYLCWGKQCFNAIDAGTLTLWEPNDSTILAPGDTAGSRIGEFGLKIYIDPKNKIGEALYEYQIYDTQDVFGLNTKSIYVKYDFTYTTGLKEQRKNKIDFSVYPNPTNSITNINVKSATNLQLKVVVRDMLGKVVKTVNVNSSKRQLSLDMSSYNKGIYFVSSINEQEILSTKKLIVK